VSAIVLMQFGILNSRLGNTVITAAVVNDIMSLIVLSIILQVASDGGTGQLNLGDTIVSAINIAVFLGGIFLVDILLRKIAGGLRRKIEPFFKKLQTKEAAFGVLLITAIAISLIAQDIGLHFVIGTFFSGLVIYKGRIGQQNFNKVYGTISAITFGFFAPIFFALIGIGFAAGVIDMTLFSIAVAIGLVTTILAPLTSRPMVSSAKSKGSDAVLVKDSSGKEWQSEMA
jgi:Kef-type K+ transport system membrane component KefB